MGFFEAAFLCAVALVMIPRSRWRAEQKVLAISSLGDRIGWDLDIGVGIEGGFDGVAGLVVGIIDEQPDPPAAPVLTIPVQ